MEFENNISAQSKVKSGLWKLKHYLPKDRNRRLSVLLVALLALPFSLVLVQRAIRYFSRAASATLTFQATSTALPPNQTVRLMANTGTTQVGFTRVEINYDTTKVRLVSEVGTSNQLTMNNADVPTGTALPTDACQGTMPCIIKTPMASANNTGKIVLVLAKDPRVTSAAPSGTFELANFTFAANTAVNTTTQLTMSGVQMVDLSPAEFIVSASSLTLTLNAGGATPTPSSGIISGLQVFDTANAADWHVMTNLQVGNIQYGDRTFTFTAVPANVAGSEWIQTANDSKASTLTTVASFTVNSSTVVYVAHDDRFTPKPSWLTGWTDSGMNLVNNESVPNTFSMYSKSFSTGQTVSLGPNGGSGVGMYTVVVKGVSVTPTLTPTPTKTPTPTLVPPTPTPTSGPTNTPVPTVTPVVGCNQIPGDVNADGKVSITDVLLVVLVFDTSPPGNPCADINLDGRVSITDVIIVVNNFGRTS